MRPTCCPNWLCSMSASILGLVTCVAGAQSDDRPDATVASQVREAISLDPTTLAALDVDSQTAQTLALDAIDDAQARLEMLAPMSQRCMAARAACAYAWGQEDIDAVFMELSAALAALSENQGERRGDNGGAFDQDVLDALDRAAANIVLDSPIRLLDLDADQREILWNAQAVRNSYILNPETAHRAASQAAAWEDYWRTVEQTLSPQQYAELTQYYENIDAHLSDIMAAEDSAVVATQEASLRGWRQFFANLRSPAQRLVPQALVWVARKAYVGRAWLTSVMSRVTVAPRPAGSITTLGLAQPRLPDDSRPESGSR